MTTEKLHKIQFPNGVDEIGEYATIWDYEEEIPADILADLEEKYGEVLDVSKKNPVRNTAWELLKFKDPSIFRPAAAAFEASERAVRGTPQDPCYTNALPGTIQHKKYWREQLKRCKFGYSAGGLWIPGEYYFYLNFTRIEKVVNEATGETRLDFPSFLAMDYYWFLELYVCDTGLGDSTKKQHMIAAKARRKGFSFKNAAGCVWKFLFFPQTKTAIVSQFGAKARNTFEMALNIIDFINKYTEFGTPTCRKVVNDNGCRIVAGQEAIKDGMRYIKGRKSEILTVSLNNKDDAAAGLGCIRVIFEEAGMIKNLKVAWRFTEPTLRSGSLKKGIGIIYGTGGDMSKNAREFSEMFNDPQTYSLKQYNNIYEKNQTNAKCGWFVDDMWFREGAYIFDKDGKKHYSVDKAGNAYRWVAEVELNQQRLLAQNASKKDYMILLTQNCKTPSEAFLTLEGNVFPVAELYERKASIQAAKHKYYTAGILTEAGDKTIKFKPNDLIRKELRHDPVIEVPLNTSRKDFNGCIMQYYEPERVLGEIPDDSYIIGVDPWGINAELEKANTDTSMGSCYVMRTSKHFDKMATPPHTIVATYVGRTATMDEFNENLLKLSKYYNAKINFENDRGEIRPYFTNRKELKRLCKPPGQILEKNEMSVTMRARKYGYSMSNKRFKRIGIEYLKDWLYQVDPNGNMNLFKLEDLPLIEEMISFNFEEGNFDRVMSMIGCVLYDEDTYNKFEEEEKGESKLKFLTGNGLFRKQKDKVKNTTNKKFITNGLFNTR